MKNYNIIYPQLFLFNIPPVVTLNTKDILLDWQEKNESIFRFKSREQLSFFKKIITLLKVFSANLVEKY